ncbi:phage minor capsid protein [uncultured Limosilactobacillus sp.]|uniref:phage minor capsid protein n=1 Tax=uncultured Limosilactobacillus sp. TaxID=2837629 RepID=UPI0025DD152B|nr:phage minor capsid protein [uncultured Limosilactobacillus sp.]
MGARERFEKNSQQIMDTYSALQDQIFKVIIDTLQEGDYKHIDQADVVLWQAKQLQKIGKLNRQTMQLMANADGLSKAAVEDMVKFNGLQVQNEVDDEIQGVSDAPTPVSSDISMLLNGIVDQTWTDLQNNVNEALVTRNYGASSVTKVYRRILSESTAATVSGLLTHQDAVESAVYRAVDRGLPTKLVDKAGHNWSLEGYTRSVIRTTVNQTYNSVRLKRMKEFGMSLALMSSHPNSRPACAYIQGHVVNLVPPEDPAYNDKYDSIYNHGYGEPAGTQGVNCRHRLFPYVPGVSVNHQHQYDPEEAIANGKLVQKQRARERAICDAKHRLKAAEEIGDVDMINKTKTLLHARQKNLREFIKHTNHEHKKVILTRDYSREKALGPHEEQTNYINQHRAKELVRLKKTYGSHGFPKTPQEYQRLLYNKSTGQAMHAYVQARKQHTVEPVVKYTDYIRTKKRLDKEVIGMTTSTGQVIKSYSDHTFDRIFGVRKDQHGKLRIGVSIEQLKQALQSQRHLSSKQRNTETYITNQARVIVNTKGNIVTLVPRKEK